MKRLRSLLSTPANRPDLVQKAAGYGADALILDLQDAVPLAQKADARPVARQYVEDFAAQGLVMYVRVNELESGLLEDDLDAIACTGLEGVQLPKVSAPDTVRSVDRFLSDLERERGLEPGRIELLVSIETAAGVQFVHPILSAADRVGSALVGTAEDGDLHGDLGYIATETEEETLYARSRVLLAARVLGMANPVDGVYPDFRNDAGLEANAQRARRLGYKGKKVIHPRQVAIVNRIFSLTAGERDRYQRVLAAFEDALEHGAATAVVDGKMVDYAMAETARRVLAWGDAPR